MSDASVPGDNIEQVIVPKTRDLGSLEVRRVLPAPDCRAIGPFVFFDQVGPTQFKPGEGIDIRPHPHIGLATLTYLFDGEFRHRDSLGTDQMIYPGAVNWMVAGRGITHSERTSDETRAKPHQIAGIQIWIALPRDQETIAPMFEHHAKSALPLLKEPGRKLRVVLGTAFDQTSPVRTFSDVFLVDARLDAGHSVDMPIDHQQRGLYVTSGAAIIDGTRFEAGRMLVFRPGTRITATAADDDSRFILAGGAPLESPRLLSWNFVASSQELIDQAASAWREADWENGQFSLPPGDDQEYIPLP